MTSDSIQYHRPFEFLIFFWLFLFILKPLSYKLIRKLSILPILWFGIEIEHDSESSTMGFHTAKPNDSRNSILSLFQRRLEEDGRTEIK